MRIAIADIHVRERVREDMGNLNGLVESIRIHGLIHPIVIDDSGNLVAGCRRLAACKELGMESVEVRKFGDLTAKERGILELEENLHRKGLTPYERSKAIARYTEAAQSNGGNSPKKDRRGRKPKRAVSERDTEEQTGVDRRTARDAEAHVKAAERYPFLMNPGWNQASTLEMAKALDALPDEDRKKTLAFIDEHSAQAPSIRAIVKNISRASEAHRKEIWRSLDSEDPRERGTTISLLGDTSPNGDPRLIWISRIIGEGQKEAARFPDEPISKCILELVALAKKIEKLLEEEREKLIENGKEILA